ncbi:MFS transporter [Paenibacillaceae bacterium T2]|uniref:MFS transporter n=1 Tax=Ferviditalea candida TaxID=3108399 RepID=A0ABU5ZKB0_9BACL|nr:MFS transporter [Paenibacillaceae bacterium T2]
METWKRNLWLLWFGSLITSASYTMVIPFLPLFLIQIGVHQHEELWSGLLFSSAFLAGAIASPFWGAMGDKYGRKPMIGRAGLVLFVTYCRFWIIGWLSQAPELWCCRRHCW